MRPIFRIIAGPNGSGKSSLTRSLDSIEGMKVLDPDAIARELDPEQPERLALQAGRLTLARLREYFETGQSFSIETTLSSGSNIEWMKQARTKSFFVELFYIALDNPQLNINRVLDRKRKGGHTVPVEDVLRRYGRSLNNLMLALEQSDSAVIYDNSIEMTKVLEFESGFITWREPDLPEWLLSAIPTLLERSS